jgi:hypothetical protein
MMGERVVEGEVADFDSGESAVGRAGGQQRTSRAMLVELHGVL